MKKALWKKIPIGFGIECAEALGQALKASGYRQVSGYRTGDLERKMEVSIMSATLGQMGFKNTAYYSEICARAVEIGWELWLPSKERQLHIYNVDEREFLFICLE